MGPSSAFLGSPVSDSGCHLTMAARRTSSGVIELPRVVATEEQVSQDFQPGPIKTTVVTVAVAAGDSIARYEGTLRPDVPLAVAEQIVGLARRLKCSAKPPAGQTQRELQMLKNTPLKWEPVSELQAPLSENGGGSPSLAGPPPQPPR